MTGAEVAKTVARRPHRADAARNFDALPVAARVAFAEHGSQASLEDIARNAGVGIGTLYRNFPTRQHLFNSVYTEEIKTAQRDRVPAMALDGIRAADRRQTGE
jgi:AcrR family transcriptional regulator